jgi:hypothetical protein
MGWGRSILVPRPKLGRPSQWPWVRLLINLVPRAFLVVARELRKTLVK